MSIEGGVRSRRRGGVPPPPIRDGEVQDRTRMGRRQVGEVKTVPGVWPRVKL
jgi:hypothetical protein